MKRSIVLALAVVMAGAFGFGPTQAAGCDIASGSATSPHLVDDVNDALLAQTDPTIEELDSSDLTGAWFSRNGSGGTELHIQVRNLIGPETNLIFYALWDYQGTDPTLVKRRFVSAQLRPTAEGVSSSLFRYGYLDTTATPQSFTSQGFTTGRVDAGAREIVVDVPLDKLGNPGTGATLGNVMVESRLLAGHPGHGRPDITTTGAGGGGLVFVADATTGDPCTDITV